MAKVRLSRSELFSNTRVRLSRAELSGSTAIVVAPIAPVEVEPGITTTVTAALTTGTADSWAWSQLSGPTVTLSGSGASRSFLTPASLVANVPTAVVIVLGVTATKDAIPSPQVSATVTVRPELEWSRVDGSDWVGSSRG